MARMPRTCGVAMFWGWSSWPLTSKVTGGHRHMPSERVRCPTASLQAPQTGHSSWLSSFWKNNSGLKHLPIYVQIVRLHDIRGQSKFWKTKVAWSAKASDSLICINSWQMMTTWFLQLFTKFHQSLTSFEASLLPVFRRVSSIIFKTVSDDYVSHEGTLWVSISGIKKPTLVRIGFSNSEEWNMCYIPRMQTSLL